MATRDLVHNVKPVVGLTSLLRTATTLSAACDTQGFQSVSVIATIGAVGDVQSGSIYWEYELQESDDNSTYTAVADADLLLTGTRTAITGTAVGTFVSTKTTGQADTAGTYMVGYRGSKRYLKVNQRATGTHTTGEANTVLFLLGNPDYSPAQ